MINEMRMKELAEKFASELASRMDGGEILDFCLELDITEEEAEYFGWVKPANDHIFSCLDCPYYYADCEDEDDLFEEEEMYCHYDGPDNEAPCVLADEPDDDYSSNAPCDNTGFCCGATCPHFYTCQN